MTELHELLDRAAGELPTAVPVPAIRRRGQALARRRRLTTGACLLVIAGVLGLAFPHLTSRTNSQPATQVRMLTQTPGVLAPGVYRDSLLNPDLDFTVPVGYDRRTTLVNASSLVIKDDLHNVTVSVLHWRHLYSADTRALQAVPPPAGLLAWLTHHRGLKVAESQETTFAGKPAHSLRLTARPGQPPQSGPALGCTAGDCIPIAETDDNPIVLYYDASLTVIIPDTMGRGLIVTALQPTDTFGVMNDDVISLIDSITPATH